MNEETMKGLFKGLDTCSGQNIKRILKKKLRVVEKKI